MNYLLDTHTFLWLISEPEKLSPKAKDIIKKPDNALFLSSASGWEVVIKTQIGKLFLPEQPDIYIPKQMELNSIELLAITMKHALNIFNLPYIHKDPFDRILISQSIIENIPIITSDTLITKYNVNIVW